MTEHAELIEQGQKILSVHTSGGGFSLNFIDDFITDAIAALKEQPFNVLKHLRAGKQAVNQHGMVIYQRLGFLCDGLIVWKASDETVHPSILSDHDWQPYHEPPAHGSKEWAVAYDGRVTHGTWKPEWWHNFKKGTRNAYGICPDLNIRHYAIGWSEWVEQHKVGYYLADINQKRIVWWDGTHWKGGPNTPDSWRAGPFEFYEKTRYLGTKLFPEQGVE